MLMPGHLHYRPRVWGVGAWVVMGGEGHSSKDACVDSPSVLKIKKISKFV